MDTPITRAEHEEFKRRMEDEHKRLHHRLSDVESVVSKIYDLTTSVEKLATSVESMARVQTEHAEKLELLEGRDGEMWRKVVGYLVTGVVGIVLGFVFNQIGM